ncbi:MAG: shikimate kinase [Bacteroidota bacterium]|jgi:shikimate kinase|nr:shikimate kinase [Bacteroidota bacterium]
MNQFNSESVFPPIFLIGMMGSGKSYWCKAIAKHLQLNGVDLDAYIENQQQQTIAHIFHEKGEMHFRKIESVTLHSLGIQKNMVIATGGGTPCFYDNMKWMNMHGITIWINEPISTLTERLWKERIHRPLIAHFESKEALSHFLITKLEERNSFYKMANVCLNEPKLTIQSFIKAIQSLAPKSFNLNHS